MPPAGPTAADLTVVVSSHDVDGDAVRDLALQWHEDGLLGDFAWVTPAEVERGAYGPPVIRARVTGRSSIGSTQSVYYMIKVMLAVFVGLLRARPAIDAGADAAVHAEHGI